MDDRVPGEVISLARQGRLLARRYAYSKRYFSDGKQ